MCFESYLVPFSFSAIECLVVVLAQLVCTVFTVAILQYSNNTGILVLPPIEYTGSAYGDGNPWIVVRAIIETFFLA